MSAFLLRVEAVNLANFLSDTQDLSTIRGGGLALLKGPRDTVFAWLQDQTIFPEIGGEKNVDRITSGPSLALFRLQLAETQTAQTVADRVAQRLRQDSTLGWATFVVDIIPESGDFNRDKEELLARNRWRQMQQTHVVVPEMHSASATPEEAWQVCEVDFVSPAVAKQEVSNEKKRRVSRSVQVRAEYGRLQKHRFFEEETGWKLPRHEGQSTGIAQDFHQLSARRSNRFGVQTSKADPLFRLHDKLAIIYIDGNSFSKLQQEYVNSPERQASWDAHVQDFRKQFLKSLLDEIDNDPEWKCKLSEHEIAIRLEVLAWGGDELLLAVPAWKGWSTVDLFLKAAASFYRNEDLRSKIDFSPEEPAPPPDPKTSQKRPQKSSTPAGAAVDFVMERPKPPDLKRFGKVPTVGPSSKKQSKKRKPKPVPALARRTHDPHQSEEGKGSAERTPELPSLTHAVGVVFCHAETPISNVRGLATSLADLGKERNRKSFGDKIDQYEDVVMYTVLESIDQHGQDILEATRSHVHKDLQLGPDADPDKHLRDALTRNAAQVQDVLAIVKHIQSCRFPKGSVYRLVKCWQSGDTENFHYWFARATRDCSPIAPAVNEILKNPEHGYLWLHIAELWDYVPVDSTAERLESAK